MAENLREVIARRLAGSPSSNEQTPAPAPAPTLKEVPQEVPQEVEKVAEVEELKNEEIVVEETPAEQNKVPENAPETVTDEDKTRAEMQEQAQRVMMLQDSGIFRSELLHQLNDISRSLTVIAGVCVELTKTNDK